MQSLTFVCAVHALDSILSCRKWFVPLMRGVRDMGRAIISS